MKSDFSHKTHIHLLILAILAILIYSNTFHADFAFDDEQYIVQNPAIKNFNYFLEPLSVLELTNIPANLRYNFITRIAAYFTFALNYHIHGLNVTGYHVVNLLIHIINALLVYFFIRLLFRTPFFSNVRQRLKSAPFLTPDVFALFSALIFVSHPVQTQAVTYITQRLASLATLFFLLSLLSYVKSRISGTGAVKYVLYGISLLSAVTAMLIKEISFTLPVLILLFEILFMSEKYWKRAVLLLPFALTMLIIPTTILMAQDSISIDAIDQSMNILASSPDMDRMDHLFTQFRVIVTYIRLLFFPLNQNLDYDYPVYNSFFALPVFFSFLFLVFLFCMGVYALYRSNKESGDKSYAHRLIGLGILWFFMTLSVESSIIPIKDIIFEHRLYLPSVGFIIAIMAAITLLAQKANNRRAVNVMAAVIIVISLLLGGAAYARNRVWKNNIVLWEDVIKKSPFKVRPHINLGLAYYEKGRIDDAISTYLRAIDIQPDAEALYNLGTAYDKKGRIDDAISAYLRAIQMQPNFAQAHNNLGILYGREGHMDKAMNEFLMTIQIDPNHAKAHNNLGILYGMQGHTDKAVKEYLTAIQISPDFQEAHYGLGAAFMTQGRIQEAVREFETVLNLNPNHAGARKNLDMILRMKK